MGIWNSFVRVLRSLTMSSEDDLPTLVHHTPTSVIHGSLLAFCEQILEDPNPEKFKNFTVHRVSIWKKGLPGSQHEVCTIEYQTMRTSVSWTTVIERSRNANKIIASTEAARPVKDKLYISPSNPRDHYVAVDSVFIRGTQSDALAAAGAIDGVTCVLEDVYDSSPNNLPIAEFPGPLTPVDNNSVQGGSAVRPTILHVALICKAFIKAFPHYNIASGNCYHMAGALACLLHESCLPMRELRSKLFSEHGHFAGVNIVPGDLSLTRAQLGAVIHQSAYGQAMAIQLRQEHEEEIQRASRAEDESRRARKEAREAEENAQLAKEDAQLAKEDAQLAKEDAQLAKEAIEKLAAENERLKLRLMALEG